MLPALHTEGAIIDESMPPSPKAGWYTDPWNAQQLRYFDGTQWTSHTAVGTGPGESASTTTPQPESGYPLGERILLLRAIADKHDANIVCSVENVNDQQLALIRPQTSIPWANRATADLPFAMVRPDGTPMLHLTRYGGLSGHIIQVNDPEGRDLGRLRQTASRYWTRMPMALEFGGQQLGRAQLVPNRRKRAAVHEPIYDSTGTAVAYMDRRWRPRTGSRNPQFDYTLDCSAPTPHPLPVLILATAFAHYMYDRLQMGGPFGGHRNPSPLN